jgi:hypothetical protein
VNPAFVSAAPSSPGAKSIATHYGERMWRIF